MMEISVEQYNKMAERLAEVEYELAESVKVVWCKDCRWWNSETKGCKRNPSVKAWQEDDFCKYGKRWSNAID